MRTVVVLLVALIALAGPAPAQTSPQQRQLELRVRDLELRVHVLEMQQNYEAIERASRVPG